MLSGLIRGLPLLGRHWGNVLSAPLDVLPKLLPKRRLTSYLGLDMALVASSLDTVYVRIRIHTCTVYMRIRMHTCTYAHTYTYTWYKSGV